MRSYTAIAEISFPQIGKRVHVGDTVGKILPRYSVYIDSTEYDDRAVFDWVGTANSLLYLAYTGDVVDPPYFGLATPFGGSQIITAGAEEVTVAGQSFGFIPTTIVVTVLKPDGTDSNIFGTVRASSISATGFTVDFSSAVPDAGYTMAYFVGPLGGQLIPSTNFVGGSVVISNGVLEVTVLHAFGFVPTTVVVSVTKPDGVGLNIFATVKADSITATGFIVDLSGAPDSVGYLLNYFVK